MPKINAAWLGAITAVGPYRIPHVKVEVFGVYTNKTMSGAFRGYGTPQVNFARESQLDKIARDLNIDPVEIRLKNCLKTGDVQPTGHKLVSVNIEKTIIEAAEKIGWKKSQEQNRAFGLRRFLLWQACHFVCQSIKMARQSLIQGCGYGSRFKLHCLKSLRAGSISRISLLSADTGSYLTWASSRTGPTTGLAPRWQRWMQIPDLRSGRRVEANLTSICVMGKYSSRVPEPLLP
jgi:hypothetical protein